jgi:zinc transporter, ZIP family
VLEAAGWGLVGGGSLLLGAALGLVFSPGMRTIGLVLAFGAGTLISALTFELTDEAFALGGADAVALGLAAGALVYFAGDWIIDHRGGDNRMCAAGQTDADQGSASALLVGAVLDGIPESMVIGLTLLTGEGIGIAVVAAVFLSNLPESLSAATGMRKGGHRPAWIIGVWALVTAVCGLAAAAGFGLLDGASGNLIGFINAFAAGAVLTLIADAMMPEAFDHGGKVAGLVTVLGFALAFLLTTLD